MATIYAELAGVAQELINQFGREVQIRRQGTTERVLGEPWRGRVPLPTVNVTAAIFDATSYDRAASPTLEFQFTALIAARGLTFEPKAGDTVIDPESVVARDDGATPAFHVVRSTILKPGTVGLVYTLSLATANT